MGFNKLVGTELLFRAPSCPRTCLNLVYRNVRSKSSKLLPPFHFPFIQGGVDKSRVFHKVSAVGYGRLTELFARADGQPGVHRPGDLAYPRPG